MEEAAKRKTKGDGDSSSDRLSTLPEPILHHILCFLDQKTSVQTCLLSKPWGHLSRTRPKIEFTEGETLAGNRDAFLSVVDRTLQASHGLQDFFLRFSSAGDSATEFLNKWIPTLVHKNAAVTTLDLGFYSNYSRLLFQLPSSVFESESIRNLSLQWVELKSTPVGAANYLKRLRKLRLDSVYVPEETLDNILSNCAFLEDVYLAQCKGFTSVRLLNNGQRQTNLKRINVGSYSYSNEDITVEIGSNIRTVSALQISGCLLSVTVSRWGVEFSRLKSLSLTRVRLLCSDWFSCARFPCLEELKLERCQGIEYLDLLCCPSMKHLRIINVNRPFMATVDAPSLVSFFYWGFLPQSISFSAATASGHGWESSINFLSFDDISNESSSCFNELTGLLKALSRSQISLGLDESKIHWLRNLQDKYNTNTVGVSGAELPVAVEYLNVHASSENLHSSSADFLNNVFHLFRPRFISMGLFTNPKTELHQVEEILFKRREMAQCDFWQRVLEGVSIQAWYMNESECRPVQSTSLTEFGKNGKTVVTRFHLKWRA